MSSPFDPTKYTGPNKFVPYNVNRPSDPNSPIDASTSRFDTDGAFYKYNQEGFTFWITDSTGKLFYLAGYNDNGTAIWRLLAPGGSGPVTTLRDQQIPAVTVNPDFDGHITMIGAAVANDANPMHTSLETVGNAGAFTMTYQIQAATSSTSAAASINKSGIAHFDSTQFTVDPATGFVSLSGGGLAVDSFQVQSVTAPGVNPVAPTAAGLITFNGGVVANNSVPVQTHTDALNTMNLEVQYATSAAATDGTKSGLAHFDSSAFNVDASGFVQLNGGLAVTSFDVQANTPPGTDPVVPSAAGVVIVNGNVVANNSVPLRTNSIAVNSYDLEVQYATSAAATDGTKSGVSHYDSSQFTVDASAFVQIKPQIFPFEIANIGIAYSAGTFTVQGYNGSALSATNPGIVWLQNKSTPGQLILYLVTANQTFTDGSAGQIDNMRWGVTTGVNWASDCPFFLYAVGNDAQDTISFMISRVPNAPISPVAASIGKVGAVVNNSQGDFYSLANVTVADYDQNPCVCLGSFRMQFAGATDSWTVQALSTSDGIGEFQEGISFTYPVNQNGATPVTNATTHFVESAGFPAFSTRNAAYRINRLGIVEYGLLYGNMTAGGVNATAITCTVPLQSLQGFNGCIGWFGDGASPAVGFLTAATLNASASTFLMKKSTGNVATINTDFVTTGATAQFSHTFQYRCAIS